MCDIVVYYSDGSFDAFPNVTDFGDDGAWTILKLAEGFEEHLSAANVRRMTVKRAEPQDTV